MFSLSWEEENKVKVKVKSFYFNFKKKPTVCSVVPFNKIKKLYRKRRKVLECWNWFLKHKIISLYIPSSS